MTSHLLLQPSPAQLASQAETIADLTFQRNMLLEEREEDHARFEAERESWTRNADALLAKASVAQEPIIREQVRALCSNLRLFLHAYSQETQRHISRLEDDNKAYRRRVRVYYFVLGHRLNIVSSIAIRYPSSRFSARERTWPNTTPSGYASYSASRFRTLAV